MRVGTNELGRILGVTHAAIIKAHRAGRIPKEADGTFDVETCKRLWSERARPRANGIGTYAGAMKAARREAAAVEPIPTDGTLSEALRREAWAKVKDRELKLAVVEGELAPIAHLNAWAAGMIVRAKDVLLRMAPELKERLAQTADPNECERLIEAEAHRALRQLAEYRPSA